MVNLDTFQEQYGWLLAAAILGSGGDFYELYRGCKPLRDQLDQHLLEQKRIELQREKEKLLKQTKEMEEE